MDHPGHIRRPRCRRLLHPKRCAGRLGCHRESWSVSSTNWQPIYLSEVSPPAFRASFAGLAYQLGNMASSGAAQIEADAGETLRVVIGGKELPDYATIFGILLGVIIAWLLM